MRVAFIIEYDGTNYNGWQIQPNGKTIQETIQTAIFMATKERVTLTASGRTDSGVHAKGQVAHFDTTTSIPAEKIYICVNAHLPLDIRILQSFEVDNDFHARYQSKQKTYEYSFYKSTTALPLKQRYAVNIPPECDTTAMQAVCDLFIGTHDFACFKASNSSIKTTTRTIYDAKIIDSDDTIKFRITGNGFLYNMVRIMAGVIIDASLNRIDLATIKKAIQLKDRSLLGKTMPPNGLCLVNVEYKCH